MLRRHYKLMISGKLNTKDVLFVCFFFFFICILSSLRSMCFQHSPFSLIWHNLKFLIFFSCFHLFCRQKLHFFYVGFWGRVVVVKELLLASIEALFFVHLRKRYFYFCRKGARKNWAKCYFSLFLVLSFLLMYYSLFCVQALNAQSRALLMQKLDRSGIAARFV